MFISISQKIHQSVQFQDDSLQFLHTKEVVVQKIVLHNFANFDFHLEKVLEAQVILSKTCNITLENKIQIKAQFFNFEE